MSNIVAEKKIQSLAASADKIHAQNLVAMLDYLPPAINILSLDCFDTLLWRKTAAPLDVFYDLQNKPAFQAIGFSASLRINAEGRARMLAGQIKGSPEVSLHDIYTESFPDLEQAQLDALVQDELEAEIEACYALPAMVDLIRAAHSRGFKIIIVSDTYFSEKQLRTLLASSLPDEVLAMFNKIYCSSDYGRSKSYGLFNDVLKDGYPAESMLHIGDNLSADYIAARALKLNSLHFVHHDEIVHDILSLQAIAANIFDPSIQTRYALASPYRGLLAMNQDAARQPETIIGYATLGPIMHAFGLFVLEKVAQLKQAGKHPKVVFLMRDAYLPSLVCEALAGEAIGNRIRISRFASYAASFRSKEDICGYLVDIGQTNRFQDLSKQLLIPDTMSEHIIKAANQSENPINEFALLVQKPNVVKVILNESEKYRARLLRHLENEIGLQSGDTLILVDLGYTGTTQRRLSPVFEQMGIEVTGCYLLAMRIPGWEKTRSGLLDPSWCDDKALQTLVFYIILLEQLCTSNEKSVIDYDQNGNAIYSETTMSDQQHAKLIVIQAECLRFIHEAKNFFSKISQPISSIELRQTAMAQLGRLMFLPTESEINYLQSFQAEMNLGTNEVMRIFDAEQGIIGLRRRGVFYMEKPSKTTRTNYPAELRVAGIELALTLIAQHRFGLDIKLKDMMPRHERLVLIFRQGQETHQTAVEAIATHDGYFAVWLPIKISVAIMFGTHYEWVQIESVELIEKNAFIRQDESQNTIDAWDYVSTEQMLEKSKQDKNGRLFECQSEAAALVINTNETFNKIESVCRVVFRPIIMRES
jgi:predicted HAD superfamily hydrolase